MLDNCQRDTALLRQCKLDVVSLKRELTDAKGVIGKHTEDIAALERLDSSRVAKLGACYESHDKLENSSKNGWTWAKVFGIFAVVEGVVIGVAVGTR